MKNAWLMGIIWSMLCAPLCAQSVFNPDKGAPSPDSETTLGCTAIPDDAYDGSLGSMACFTVSVPIPVSGISVEDVSLDISMNHTWVGDLVIKVQSPESTVLTVMSQPGLDEMVDDGTSCCGNDADLLQTSPLSFSDTGLTSAEDMGATGGVVCQDDGLCSYFPFPDSGPGTLFSEFIGENAFGDWMVCVGDAAAGDTGEVCDVSLVVDTDCFSCVPIPALDKTGLLVLLLGLASVGVLLLRRRA